MALRVKCNGTGCEAYSSFCFDCELYVDQKEGNKFIACGFTYIDGKRYKIRLRGEIYGCVVCIEGKIIQSGYYKEVISFEGEVCIEAICRDKIDFCGDICVCCQSIEVKGLACISEEKLSIVK